MTTPTNDQASDNASTQDPDLRIPSLFDVSRKVAVVTGGASGIGLAITTALVQNGAKVYISSRNLTALESVATQLTKTGPGTCIAIQADLTTAKACRDLATTIMTRDPVVHILINNSGISWGSSLTEFDEKNGWDRLMALNVKSSFYLTTSLIPALSAGANGNTDPARVINISSIAGTNPSAESALSRPGNGTWSYSASKAAVNQLTVVLASTLAKHYITVNAIAPGVFPSRMTRHGLSTSRSVFEMSQPLGRIGVASDISGVVLFLASIAGAHVTGAVIPVDGGQRLVGDFTALSKL